MLNLFKLNLQNIVNIFFKYLCKPVIIYFQQHPQPKKGNHLECFIRRFFCLLFNLQHKNLKKVCIYLFWFYAFFPVIKGHNWTTNFHSRDNFQKIWSVRRKIFEVNLFFNTVLVKGKLPMIYIDTTRLNINNLH